MNLGIKYLMTTDTTQKTAKKVERRQKGPFFIFRVPRYPQELRYIWSGGGRSPSPPGFSSPVFDSSSDFASYSIVHEITRKPFL